MSRPCRSLFIAFAIPALAMLLAMLNVAASSAVQQQPASSQPAASQPASREARGSGRRNRQAQEAPAPDYSPMLTRGVEIILAGQEGETHAEWPYEGVYRVNRQIPIGYRIGGTALCATALVRVPGYDADAARKDAVHRAIEFIIAGCAHPFMNPVYDGGYDVRGWGYTCGLAFLLELKSRQALPADLAEEVERTIRWQIDAICSTEISRVGGWNYARQVGRDAVSPPSPFMTAPTLLALFEAERQGYEVDSSVVERALVTLENARTPSGSIVYSGLNGADSSEPTPGAVGRMLSTETALMLAGKSSVAAVRGAVDAFIVHWEWLEQRRAKTGTHEPPYNIAPYYFYYAHYYAAMAVEMLPRRERAEYRRRLNDLLMKTRHGDGSWNDRVFERSANYGTAMAIMALMMPQTPPPARWGAAAAPANPSKEDPTEP